MLKIIKKNDVYLRVESEPSIARQISAHFTFEVPGARFMPAFKNKIWDGKIRMFNMMNGEIYFGLLSHLTSYLQEQDIEYEVSAELLDSEEVSIGDVEAFTKTLKLKSGGKNVKPRDYQIDALAHAFRNHRALLLSPTASGKSLIIYCLIRYYLYQLEETDQPHILIIVPTTSLVEQLASDFIDYGWQESNIQKIYSGHDKEVTKPVVISTWQSIFKFSTRYFEQFGAVIGDECLHPDTKITMSDGTLKKIKDVQVNDVVKTFNEQTKEIENKPVKKVHKNISINEAMYEIETESGNIIKITGNHKVLTHTGEWKRADELKVGDLINSIE